MLTSLRCPTCHYDRLLDELSLEALWAKAEFRTRQLLLGTVDPRHRQHPQSWTSLATELTSPVPPTTRQHTRSHSSCLKIRKNSRLATPPVCTRLFGVSVATRKTRCLSYPAPLERSTNRPRNQKWPRINSRIHSSSLKSRNNSSHASPSNCVRSAPSRPTTLKTLTGSWQRHHTWPWPTSQLINLDAELTTPKFLNWKIQCP